jgi:hypothetical protein
VKGVAYVCADLALTEGSCVSNGEYKKRHYFQYCFETEHQGDILQNVCDARTQVTKVMIFSLFQSACLILVDSISIPLNFVSVISLVIHKRLVFVL